MAWTYEARMSRAITKLIDTARIERAETHKRARFFDKYAFRVGIGVSLQQWVDFDTLMREYHDIFDPMDAHLIGVKSTFDIYVYGNDPTILTWLLKHPSVQVNSVVQTDPAFWNKQLPQKNTGKFFGEYRFRIRMRDALWGSKQENIDQLNELEVNYRLVLRRYNYSPNNVRDSFVYVSKRNEVLVLKLMFGDQVSEVSERD